MRNFWISLHLYAAAFFAPPLLFVAISGGLYLIGIKGTVTSTTVAVPSSVVINPTSASLEADVRALMRDIGITHDFEYVKKSGNTLSTRPTSRAYYEISVADNSVTVKHNVPNLQKRLIELHKGHGPLWFTDFQKVLAVGVLFLVLSGLWLGLSSPGLRARTIATSVVGLAVCLILAFVV